MKGLLLKDFYLTVRYCKAFLLIIVVFAAVSLFDDGNAFFLVYPCIIAGMLPMILYSYDEREKWHVFCETLPYTRTQFVSAKYLIGLAGCGTALLFVAGTQAVRMANASAFAAGDYFSMMAYIVAVSLASPAVLLPFGFRFGAEKGRIAYYVVIGVACAVSTFVAGRGSLAIAGVSGAILVAAAAALYAVSWLLSIAAYNRREL